LARSNAAGRRRPGAARRTDARTTGSTAAGGATSLEDATRPRPWQDLEFRPLADVTQARPLFDFAALPWPDASGLAFGWGAFSVNGDTPLAVVLVERAGRAVLLHGPLVALDGHSHDPLQIAAALVTVILEHAAAVGADTAFTRPQGLDRVWIRFGFIPVPETILPAAFAGRPGAGLYGWRGGSALWTLRDGGDAAA
jgi:hypothetical protein